MSIYYRKLLSIQLKILLFALFFIGHCMAQQTEDKPAPTLMKTTIIRSADSQVPYPFLDAMNDIVSHSRYLPQKNSAWLFRYNALAKYQLSQNTVSMFPLGGERILNNWEASKEIYRLSNERSARIYSSSPNQTSIEVSPNEKYLLVRYFGQKSELYEIETGRFISNGEKEEVIIGFNRDSNIYCGCQSITNMFVLRDVKTQKIIREYKTEKWVRYNDAQTPFEYSDREGYNPYYDGIQFTNLPAPIESPDGKYTLFFYSTYQLTGRLGIVTVCDNVTGEVVARSCIGLQNHLNPQFSGDGTLLAIADMGNKSIWVYDFTTHSSRSLIIPITSSLPAAGIQGYCFSPDNQLIVWAWELPCVFDIQTGKYSTPAPCTLSEPGYYTAMYYFSPDGKTAITFAYEMRKYNALSAVALYKRPNVNVPHHTIVGKFLFWDVSSQKVIFETEGKYLHSIFIDNDWKTIWISRMESSEEDAEQKVFTDEYDISGIINRP